MKPYTEVYDRWSFMNPDLPNPAVGGYPGADAVRRLRRQQLPVPDADQDLLRQRRPAPRRRLQPERAGRCCAAPTASCIRAAAPSAAAPAPATAPARSASRPTPSFPSTNGFAPAFNWNNGVPAYPAPPFLDPTLNAGFVTGRGTGGGVTYGDPEIGGRPPRYQNWNVGTAVRADARRSRSAPPTPAATATSSAAAAAASTQPARSPLPGARQPADADGHRRQHRRGPGHRPRRRAALRQLLRHDRPDAAAVPAVLRRDRRLRQRGALELPLAAAHRRAAALATA